MPGDIARPPAIRRIDVLGVPVSAITMADAIGTIDSWIEARTPHYVCVTGVHGVIESGNDPDLRRIHEDAGLVTPDGMPLVWLSHAAGASHVERVYGPDLMLECCAASVTRGWRHFFFGGGEGVPELLAARLTARFPGLQVCGTHSPPYRALTEAEDHELVTRLNRARPDIVWVGLGTPKQERWMAAHVGRLEAPVMVGVGAAFDFHAGLKRQAPRWMQQHGLEWAFRLMAEPRRLGRRYLVNNPLFVYRVARQLLGRPTVSASTHGG